ncbi:MAG: oligosaccharide flippase family protein, partial [Niabella sp.]
LFAKAGQFTLMPVGTLTIILQRVFYPFLAKFQNDNEKLYSLNLRYTKLTAMLVFPLFFALCIFSGPIVHVLLSDKWRALIPVMQISALAYIFYPLVNINMYIFQTKGDTSLFLKVEILVKVMGIVILFITLPFGIISICFGLLVQMLLQYIITSIMAYNKISKSVWPQFFMIFKLLFPVSLISGIVYFIISKMSNPFSQFTVGVSIYLLLCCTYFLITEKEELKPLLKFIKKK